MSASQSLDILSRREAAEYLRLQKSYLDRLASEGLGPTYAIIAGKAWYRRHDLDAWATLQFKPPEEHRSGRTQRMVPTSSRMLAPQVQAPRLPKRGRPSKRYLFSARQSRPSEKRDINK